MEEQLLWLAIVFEFTFEFFLLPKDFVPIFILFRSTDPSNKSRLKCKKGPLSHEKMKCLFLDYVQILMISEAIQAMKVNQPMPPIFSH